MDENILASPFRNALLKAHVYVDKVVSILTYPFRWLDSNHGETRHFLDK